MDRADHDNWAMEQLKDVWKVLFADGKSGKKTNKQTSNCYPWTTEKNWSFFPLKQFTFIAPLRYFCIKQDRVEFHDEKYFKVMYPSSRKLWNKMKTKKKSLGIQLWQKFDGFLGTKSASFSFRSVCVVLHHFKSFNGGFIGNISMCSFGAVAT